MCSNVERTERTKPKNKIELFLELDFDLSGTKSLITGLATDDTRDVLLGLGYQAKANYLALHFFREMSFNDCGHGPENSSNLLICIWQL